MLILRPKGRGNWSPAVLTIEGKRATPLLIRRGHEIVIGGVTYRVSKVLP